MARLFWFISLIFAYLCPCAGTASAATTALEIQPVRLQFDARGTVHAVFIQPCGSTFQGFIYRNGADGELQVGAVLRRDNARCLGLTAVSPMRLPLLKAGDFSAIISMNPSIEAPLLRPVPMQNLLPSRSSLHAVYTSLCGTPLGLLISPQPGGHAIGMLESYKVGSGTCQRSSKLYTLQQLDLKLLGATTLIAADQDEKGPSYNLRRVPIKFKSLGNASATRHFKLSYHRACNDAPIGLVQQAEGQVTTLSMLVAHYPKMKCPSQGPQSFWSPWHERYSAALGQQLLTLKRPQNEALRLVRPTSYHLARHPAHTAIRIKALSSCTRNLGWVGRHQKGEWALGILQSASAGSCNSALKKVTYRLEINSDPVTAVKPLQLVGS